MKNSLDPMIVDAVVGGNHGDPFAILGMHKGEDGSLFVRTFQPTAHKVELLDYKKGTVIAAFERTNDAGFFQVNLGGEKDFFSYRLRLHLYEGGTRDIEDPYRFTPVLGELDVYLFAEGNHLEIHDKMGARLIEHEGVKGVAFSVWAPNAKRVSVVGPFNNWDGRTYPMRLRVGCGIWELFIPNLGEGELYKYEIKGAHGNLLPLKTDPYAYYCEKRPSNASIVYNMDNYQWGDDEWHNGGGRRKSNDHNSPISIYEVHLGSWRRNSMEGQRYLTYRELADELVPYVEEQGFTHVELLPVNEHPFDGSWGYQPTGLFAPTSRFGTPDDFRYLVDKLHQANIGVILDWVPGHFPKDGHGLAEFDGTALYEHADPRQGEHMDWGTKIYNFGRREVANFLHASALFWLEKCHIDALRVDAVASMLYLDYSREEGQWIPNEHGGRENVEAIHFLRRLNELVYELDKGYTTFAEESTAWPMVSRPTYMGGLGFGYKWNMGWMNDTLEYISEDSIHRRYHQGKLTFGLLYAFNENFVLPLSHDEVVHGKGSIFNRMPGDRWQKFANTRCYYSFMFTHPGKNLLFMGSEFAQDREWDALDSLGWHLLDDPHHKGVQRTVRDLNFLVRNNPALHERDFDSDGFEWVDFNDAENSVITFIRKAQNPDDFVLVAINLTPVPRENYRIGVPRGAFYKEVFNSDASEYGGSGIHNNGGVSSEETDWNYRPHSILATLPPLAAVVFKPE